MNLTSGQVTLDKFKKRHPEKFEATAKIFKQIRCGARIFIGTGCGEPQYLVRTLANYVETHPTDLLEAEVFHIWTLGVAPYIETRFRFTSLKRCLTLRRRNMRPMSVK